MGTTNQLLTFVIWGFGLCTTGFFFLAGCIWWMARQLPEAKSIAKDLHDIKTSLLGTMDKPGIISVLTNVRRDVEDLKRRINVSGHS